MVDVHECCLQNIASLVEQLVQFFGECFAVVTYVRTLQAYILFCCRIFLNLSTVDNYITLL